MSASEELKQLALLPEPYSGRKYRVLCVRCTGYGEVGPENHDDPKNYPCNQCEGTGLQEPYRTLVRARDILVGVVAGVEKMGEEDDWCVACGEHPSHNHGWATIEEATCPLVRLERLLEGIGR